jgi:hypothetical protein
MQSLLLPIAGDTPIAGHHVAVSEQDRVVSSLKERNEFRISARSADQHPQNILPSRPRSLVQGPPKTTRCGEPLALTDINLPEGGSLTKWQQWPAGASLTPNGVSGFVDTSKGAYGIDSANRSALLGPFCRRLRVDGSHRFAK